MRRLGLAMIILHTKFEVSTITCNEDVKGTEKGKTSRFEPPFGGLRVMHMFIYGSMESTLSTSHQ